MDQDTKITYAVIIILIVALAGLAFFLRGGGNEPIVNESTKATNDSFAVRTTTNQKTTENATTSMSTTTSNLPEKITSATFVTNKGTIEITFATDTPNTVLNFAKLAASGFYDGTRFHRVISDFMIQGGDPLSKDVAYKDRWGTGGPGYAFGDEFHSYDTFSAGTLAMANSGPNTNGSQFFIVTAQAGTPWLVGKHTVFGHVTKGMDIVHLIENVQTDGMDRPLQDMIIEKVEIH